MITGFNTDVKYGDTVYHVQTEDKGVKNPLILSLIYVKGTILDAFRIRYDEFLDSGRFSEAQLQKILEFQHRQIVGAIKRGKYQKGMALEDFVEGGEGFLRPPELQECVGLDCERLRILWVALQHRVDNQQRLLVAPAQRKYVALQSQHHLMIWIVFKILLQRWHTDSLLFLDIL